MNIQILSCTVSTTPLGDVIILETNLPSVVAQIPPQRLTLSINLPSGTGIDYVRQNLDIEPIISECPPRNLSETNSTT